MTDCCTDKACEIEALQKRQGSVLKVVLVINAVMFIVEMTAGFIAGSTALLADSLDMLGDAMVYGFSIYIVARGAKWKSIAALFKGGIMSAFGLFVLGQAVYKMLFPQLPMFEAIGIIGLLALITNTLCLTMLWQHRTDDINMRSVWLCSRNDIIANVSVLFAAGVWLTQSGWPDVLIGLAIACLFIRSAFHVLSEAVSGIRKSNAEHES